MNREQTIVITTYGHNRTIDKIAVSLFDDDHKRQSNAATYCHMTNSLELKDDNWINARIISANTPFSINTLLPDDFTEAIVLLNSRALQKVFREIDLKTLAKALKNEKDEIKEKAFSNMSDRAAKDLKEEMTYLDQISFADIDEAQKKILNIIRHLDNTGEVILPK